MAWKPIYWRITSFICHFRVDFYVSILKRNLPSVHVGQHQVLLDDPKGEGDLS